jgi:chromosome segregation ATPase
MSEISDWGDIEAQIQETKDLLNEIEQRFLQVRHDSLKQKDLQIHQEQIKSQIQAQMQNISGDRTSHNESNHKSKIRRKPITKKTNSKRGAETERSLDNSHKEELLKKLEQIDDQLEQIEADLESRLLSWSSFREPFWQIVRFVGLGIIIGVILRSCAS